MCALRPGRPERRKPITEMSEGHRRQKAEQEPPWGVGGGVGSGGWGGPRWSLGEGGEKACGLEEPLGAWGQMSAGPRKHHSYPRLGPPQAPSTPDEGG